MKFCKVVVTKVINFVQYGADSVCDSYYWVRAFVRSWCYDLRIIWIGFSIAQSFEMLKLSFGSIITSAVSAKRRLVAHINERRNIRNCNAEFGINKSVFDWARSFQWSLTHG